MHRDLCDNLSEQVSGSDVSEVMSHLFTSWRATHQLFEGLNKLTTTIVCTRFANLPPGSATGEEIWPISINREVAMLGSYIYLIQDRRSARLDQRLALFGGTKHDGGTLKS